MARTSATTPSRIAATERQQQALRYRKAGLTFDEIANKLGYRSKGAAHDAVRAALTNAIKPDANEMLALELSRLDEMSVHLWLGVRNGDTKAIETTLRIMERRAKYLGLDDYESRMAGVAEQQTVVAHIQAGMMHDLMLAVLQKLNLTDDQWAAVPSVVIEELEQLDASQDA